MEEIKKRLTALKESDSRELDLSGIDLEGVPKVISDLVFLTHLNLGFNLLVCGTDGIKRYGCGVSLVVCLRCCPYVLCALR
jgi:hypothetical protein